jgi:hypothetical protein
MAEESSSVLNASKLAGITGAVLSLGRIKYEAVAVLDKVCEGVLALV